MSDSEYGRDDDSYFGALDFGDEGHYDEVLYDDAGTAQAIEILSEDSDHPEAAGNPAEENAAQLVAVTNPGETVTVWAMGGGEIHRVDLAPEVVRMTASDLSNEILAIAHLAHQRGQSMLYASVLESFKAMGATDGAVIGEFLQDDMRLPSPELAVRTQAEVFAARYGD